jgi:hypothetical protein
MTDGQGWGQPPQYPPQGHGPQYPQGQPWQPQQYDPRRHQQRAYGQPPQQYPEAREDPWDASQDYMPPPRQPAAPQQQHRPPPEAYPRPQYQAPGRQFTPQPPGRTRPAPAPRPAPKAKAGDETSGCVRAGCLVVALAVIGCIVWLGWSIYGSSGSGTPAAAPAAAPATTSAAQAKAQAKALAKVQAEAAACAEKTSGRDVYVRTVDPGEDTETDDTGGDWQWNYGKSVCMSAVQYALSQVVPFGGDCVTVAYASDNPGYDTDSDPAPPLNDVIAEAGPGC